MTTVSRNPPPGLQLLPEKAAFLPELSALLVSDVHLGKPETFQHFGIPISNRVNTTTLERLKRACDRTGAQQLFILGDLFHARVGMVDAVIEAWLTFLGETQIEAHLILGNHDRALGDLLRRCTLTCYRQPLALADWVLSHEPCCVDSNQINVCGHVHPCVWLGRRSDRLRLPCFYWQPSLRQLTLPAFGEFTGGAVVKPTSSAMAYVIAEAAVIPIGGTPPPATKQPSP